MPSPKRDSDGKVTPHDDPRISDDDFLVRYVHTNHLHPDDKGGRYLSEALFSPSSKARDKYQSMSTDILQPMLDDGLPNTGRKGANHEGVVKMRVGDLRGLGFKVGYDPGENNDPYHVGVWGLRKGDRGKIYEKFQWVEKPADVQQ